MGNPEDIWNASVAPNHLRWLLEAYGDRLSKRQRKVLQLVDIDGLTQVKVAALLGRSPSVIREVLGRARRRLYLYERWPPVGHPEVRALAEGLAQAGYGVLKVPRQVPQQLPEDSSLKLNDTELHELRESVDSQEGSQVLVQRDLVHRLLLETETRRPRYCYADEKLRRTG